MWVQLDSKDLDQLAELAQNAAMPAIAARIRRSLLLQNSRTAVIQNYREAAREMYAEEGACEIDDDAVVSIGDDSGAYVMTWRWVEASSMKDVALIASTVGSDDQSTQK